MLASQARREFICFEPMLNCRRARRAAGRRFKMASGPRKSAWRLTGARRRVKVKRPFRAFGTLDYGALSTRL
jgi:hypothetical protein